MRRGVGIGGLKQHMQTMEKFKQVGTELETEQLEQMRAQLTSFRENLEEFARKYRRDIQKNPAFRQQFQQLCAQIGVDPLASNKGFWSELLGVGDFYYELGVQIIDVCYSTRGQNGGLLELMELRRLLERRRGQARPGDDIIRAIKKLKALGSGFTVITVGTRQLVQSVPREFNTDTMAVLSLAQTKGFVTRSGVEQQLGWSRERIDFNMNALVKDGLAWVDEQANEIQYWIPSLFGST